MRNSSPPVAGFTNNAIKLCNLIVKYLSKQNYSNTKKKLNE